MFEWNWCICVRMYIQHYAAYNYLGRRWYIMVDNVMELWNCSYVHNIVKIHEEKLFATQGTALECFNWDTRYNSNILSATSDILLISISRFDAAIKTRATWQLQEFALVSNTFYTLKCFSGIKEKKTFYFYIHIFVQQRVVSIHVGIFVFYTNIRVANNK